MSIRKKIIQQALLEGSFIKSILLRKNNGIIALFALVLMSCNKNFYILLNNRTGVPKDPSVFKNKIKFNVSLLTIIDTSVVYEEYSNEKNMLERLNVLDNTIKKYLVIKFYSNGCFNVFAFDKNSLPNVNELNPNYAGTRGIYYMENNKIQYEEFSGVDQVGHLGIIKGTFRISGDMLFEKMNDRKGIDAERYSAKIYIKRKLPPSYFVYKADW